jgi:MoaA/NifB/PqqE/SkfB family radical SAM enzyme
MKQIIVYPTFRCGLGCSYCMWKTDGMSMTYANGKKYVVEKELPWRDMLALLATFKFGDAMYEFTGGEPLRYEGIASLLNSLPIWAATSNTTNSIEGINFKKCFSWTASYHPHISSKAKEKFMENISRIKSYGVFTAITMVATPQNIANVLQETAKFKEQGFAVNIHPYYDDPNFDWNKYPEEKRLLQENEFLRYGERFFNYGSIHGCEECYGGKDYFCVAPDGNIFRCVTEMTHGADALVHPSDKLHKCSRECLIPCDWHYGIKKGHDEIYAVNAAVGKE